MSNDENIDKMAAVTTKLFLNSEEVIYIILQRMQRQTHKFVSRAIVIEQEQVAITGRYNEVEMAMASRRKSKAVKPKE